MKNVYCFSLLLFLIVTSACKKENILADGKDFKLDYEFTVSFNDDNFQIHFDEVLEDSRCPLESFCLWPGRARVKIVTIANGIEKAYAFSTLAPVKMDTIFESGNDRYQFTLLEVNPFPESFFQDLETYSVEFNLKQL